MSRVKKKKTIIYKISFFEDEEDHHSVLSQSVFKELKYIFGIFGFFFLGICIFSVSVLRLSIYIYIIYIQSTTSVRTMDIRVYKYIHGLHRYDGQPRTAGMRAGRALDYDDIGITDSNGEIGTIIIIASWCDEGKKKKNYAPIRNNVLTGCIVKIRHS